MRFFVWCVLWIMRRPKKKRPVRRTTPPDRLFSKKKVFRKSSLKMNHRTSFLTTESLRLIRLIMMATILLDARIASTDPLHYERRPSCFNRILNIESSDHFSAWPPAYGGVKYDGDPLASTELLRIVFNGRGRCVCGLVPVVLIPRFAIPTTTWKDMPM